MDLTAITLTELRYLVAVADTGNFGRAALACHISQPTLSAQIKKLEDTLGVLLIERTSKRAVVTAAGQRVVEHARAVLDGMRALGEAAQEMRDPLNGRLRLGVIPTLGPYLLPSLLAALRETYPKLQLVVQENLTAALHESLLAHRLDAALLALPVDESAFASQPLFDEPFYLLTSRNHSLARKKTVKEADLQKETVLLLADGHCLRDQALAICGNRVPADDGDFSATSLETLHHLVASGFGCTLVPALAVSRLSNSETSARPFVSPPPYRRIGLVWRRSYARPDALQALAECIRKDLPSGAKPIAPA